MLEMTYQDARNFAGNRELITNLVQAKMPFKTAYQMRKILDVIGSKAQEYEVFERNLQKGAADKYGEKDAEGKLVFEMPEGETNEDSKVLKFTEEGRGMASKEMFLGMSEMGKKTFVIPRDKVSFDGVEIKVGLQDVMLLDLIVEDLEAVAPEASDPKAEESA